MKKTSFLALLGKNFPEKLSGLSVKGGVGRGRGRGMFMTISFTNVLLLFQHLVPLPLVVAFSVTVKQLVREASLFC